MTDKQSTEKDLDMILCLFAMCVTCMDINKYTWNTKG